MQNSPGYTGSVKNIYIYICLTIRLVEYSLAKASALRFGQQDLSSYFQGNKKADDKLATVPDGHEGDAQKETQDTSKLCHQGSPGVDQDFSLHHRVVRYGPQREHKVTRWKRSWLFLSNEPFYKKYNLMLKTHLYSVQTHGDLHPVSLVSPSVCSLLNR